MRIGSVFTLPSVLVAFSVLLLLVQPLLWLAAAGTSALPAVLSWLTFLLLVAAAWAYLCEEQPQSGMNQFYACVLLALGSLLGAVATTLRLRGLKVCVMHIEAYALAAWAGLLRRRLQPAPVYLALLGFGSLLLERLVLRRLLGDGLHRL